MKVEDLKILIQLSSETQARIKLELTVSELFAYAKFLNEEEKPKKEKAPVQRKTPETEVKPEITEVVEPVISVPENEAPEEPDGTLYYTVKDVADIYNVSIISVYKWAKKGLLKTHHKKGKTIYFSQTDVRKLKAKRGKRKPQNDVKE
jgi:dGTP triphosphohydrolase